MQLRMMLTLSRTTVIVTDNDFVHGRLGEDWFSSETNIRFFGGGVNDDSASSDSSSEGDGGKFKKSWKLLEELNEMEQRPTCSSVMVGAVVGR